MHNEKIMSGIQSFIKMERFKDLSYMHELLDKGQHYEFACHLSTPFSWYQTSWTRE